MTDASTGAPTIEASVSIVDASFVDATDADAAPEDLAVLFENGVTLLEAAGEIVHANLGDCNAMGERLEEYQQAHPSAVARVQALYDPGRVAERKAMQSRYRTRFRAAWGNVRPGITKCKDSPKVNRVIHMVWGDDLDAGSMPPPP